MFFVGLLSGLVFAVVFEVVAFKLHQRKESKKGNKLTYTAYVKGIQQKK